MAWKYCENCDCVLHEPTVENIAEGGEEQFCDCGEEIEYTPLQIIAEAIVELKERISE